MSLRPTSFFALATFLLAGLLACDRDADPASRRVVVYTALDQLYSEPILQAFEQETGIAVDAVYDTEAAKTTGLVNRLIAERARPRCDVFWNNEIVRTIRLQQEGLLQPYRSPSAAAIPDVFKDPDGHWTGFAARARVLAYNTNRLTPAELPASLRELTDPRWRGRVGMAYPLFGTTATHAAVLWARWGDAPTREFFAAFAANELQILEGNMAACRAVAEGELDLCLTDTDDASLLRGQGLPVDFVILPHAPQPGLDDGGGLLIPNTVALVADAPNPDAGRLLIDFLLRPETESMLAATPSMQLPLHPEAAAPEAVKALAAAPDIDPQYQRAAAALQPSAEFLRGLFTR